MWTMNFAPPAKRDGTSAKVVAKTEVLLLQPFSQAPQLCFNDVPVGGEASQPVKVCNPSDVAHTVVIERVPQDRGFVVDAEVFKVVPRGHQVLNVTWKPAADDSSCRVTIGVRSDQGYKGGLVCLATVKKYLKRASRQPQKPHTKVLAQSQQLNVPQRVKKAAPALAHLKKPNTTIPVEFNFTKRRGSRAKVASAEPAAKSSPFCKVQQTPKAVGEDLDLSRRETFVRSTDLYTVPATMAVAIEEFDDSLNPKHTSAVHMEVRDTTFTPPSSPRESKKENACQEDSFNSSLNFSARMEERYQKLLQSQSQSTDADQMDSSHESSMRMQERYEEIFPQDQSPTEPSMKLQVEELKKDPEPECNTPPLPDIADVVAQLEQGLEQGLNLGGDANDGVNCSLLDIIQKYGGDSDLLELDEFSPAILGSSDRSPEAP